MEGRQAGAMPCMPLGRLSDESSKAAWWEWQASVLANQVLWLGLGRFDGTLGPESSRALEIGHVL